MPFPFLPFGVLLGLAVLAGVLTLFGLALRLVDRAILEARPGALPGMVAGFRRWLEERQPSPPEPAAPPADRPAALTSEVEELAAPAVATRPVAGRRP